MHQRHVALRCLKELRLALPGGTQLISSAAVLGGSHLALSAEKNGDSVRLVFDEPIRLRADERLEATLNYRS
jgi:hypothetical protein